MWIVDADRDDGKRFVLHADESLSALWELESVIRGLQIGLTAGWVFSKLSVAERIRIRRRTFPRQVLRLFRNLQS